MRGEDRPRGRDGGTVFEEALIGISAHLRSAEQGLPEEGSADVTMRIGRAQARVEGLLGELPLGAACPSRSPIGHLEEARDRAEERLGESGLEGQLRWAVGEALSAAGEDT